MINDSNKGEFLLGLLVGATVGAAIALLYAPAPGSDTQKFLKNATGDAVDRAGELASTVKDTAVNVTSKAQDVASTVGTKAQDVASSVSSKAQDVAGSVRSRVQDLGSQAQGIANSTTSKIADTAASIRDKVSSVRNPDGSNSGQNQGAGDDWPASLPENGSQTRTGHRDLHELETSDDPEVVADRVNDAMQGSGPEAHAIAAELAKAPTS